MTEFRLLGPVEVWVGGRLVVTGPPRQRSVLAALLADAGRPVPRETLIERVWGDDPPEGVRHALHTHIARLRRALTEVDGADKGGIAPLVHRSSGYLLEIEPEWVDIHRFRSLVRRATEPARPAVERAGLLREALDLWRGEPLSGLPGEWATRIRHGWSRQRLDASVLWARAELAAGNPDPVVGPLADLLAEYPLVEPVGEMLIRSLHAAGRTAEALECYARIRARIVDELGAEPGPTLRAAYQAALHSGQPMPPVGPAVVSAPPAVAAGQGDGHAGPAAGTATGPAAQTGPATVTGPVSSTGPMTPIGPVILTGPATSGQPDVPSWSQPGAPLAGSGTAQLTVSPPGQASTALPASDAPAGGTRQSWPRGVPAQLPLDMSVFAGRAAELTQLDGALSAAGEQPTAVVITALLGTAGVGKTALAVHWAHSIAHRFPDGQLYVNLRGFDPTGCVMEPAEAIRGFLDALGVPMARIPAGLAEQAALYRSVLAGRRMLVVLDNARDAAQVRPLLPGAPGCLAVITSRNRLTSLVAVEGAHPLAVELLPMAEARELLRRRLGAARTAAEPDAVDDIIQRCARLPLALALVAARAATHPEFPLRALAADLRDVRRGLDVFAGGDAATDVRAVFSWSYAALSAPAAGLFRLLGLHPGAEVSTASAASLAALTSGEVRPALTELTRAHLLTELAPGRFTTHDLLRAYAAELARTRDGEADRGEAVDRVLDHYLHSAYAAATVLQTHGDWITLDAPRPGTVPEVITDNDKALAWFTAEHKVLLAALRLAAETGRDRTAGGLAWSLETFLRRRGHGEDLVTTQAIALQAYRRLGDRVGQAGAHRTLARAYAGLGRYQEAYAQFSQALVLFDEVDQRTGWARTQLDFAEVLEAQGALAEALHHAELAYPIYREAGNLAGQAYALNGIGWYHAQLGDVERATRDCFAALALHREVGDSYGEAASLDSLGFAYHHLGRFDQAVECFERSLAMLKSLGDRYYEAVVLTHLGDTRHAAGQFAAAEQAWSGALVILEELDHPSADQVRENLRRSRSTSG